MPRPGRRPAAILLLATAAVLAATPAAAAPPVQFTFEVDQTVFAPGLTAACGFDVYVTTTGTAHALLFFNADGSALAREIDLSSQWRITFSAPSLGTSYTQVGAGTFSAEYPEGSDVGDPAVVTTAGLNRKIGDDPAEAGRLIFEAVIVFVDPTTGIPGVDLLALVSATGNFLGDATARRCETLSGG